MGYIGWYNATDGIARSSRSTVDARDGRRLCRYSNATISRPQEAWFPIN